MSIQKAVNELDRILSEKRLYTYKPYPKQLDFHNAGGTYGVRERLLMAGNQLGKTLSASYETAMHATGWYPDWWPGARFMRPTTGWVASNTSQGTRDSVQRLLLGPPGQWGTGAIPKALILDMKKAPHGVPDSIESIVIRHITGGSSRIIIKTYDQGRERWQGETLNYVWFDEEPPMEIYLEGLTRTNATGGLVYLTFTPLLGMSDVVRRFLIEKIAGTHVTSMTIDDALHYTQEERNRIKATYPAHERDARVNGIPTLGSGRVFPYEESMLAESPLILPPHWPRIVGVDFGYDHPAAGVWIAWDRDSDTVHIYDAYRRREATPLIHAGLLRAKGSWIPVAWPHDGEQRDKGSGAALAMQYRQQGANMLPHHATHQPDFKQGQKEGDGGTSVEAGLTLMSDRMQTSRFKVARHLADWWEEFRLYHRKDGLVVKEGDDIMSATRTGLMMLRHAKIWTPDKPDKVIVPWQPQDPSMGMLG